MMLATAQRLLLKSNQNWSKVRILHSATVGKPRCFSCWNCNKSTSNLFCQHCNSLQKPNQQLNYFQIIGVNEEFNLSESSLSVKFKELQKVLHPDKFSNKDPTEQKISEEYSSLVNKAYSTLINPLRRGTYMLRLKGQELPEKTDLESDFLHEIMERNEKVENANTPDEILKIEKENKKILEELQKELNDLLKSNDYSTAIKILVKMKYYISIEDQIKSIIRTMGIVK